MTAVRAEVDRSPAQRVSTLLFNNVVAAVLGAGLMVLVHELTHLVAGLAQGAPGELYPFAVNSPGLSDTDQAIATLAGPVFSLVSGVVLALWLPLRRRGGFAHLLWLWFAFTSMMEGVGYLVITPFGAGDTATASALLGWGTPVQLAMCAVGIALMFVLARMWAPHVGRFAGEDPRRQWAFTLWPWLIGTAVNLVMSTVYLSVSNAPLTIGEIMAISAAGTATLVFAPMAHIFARRMTTASYQPLRLPAVPVAGLIAFAVLVAFNLFIRNGITVG